jgi:hypothetical protein
VDAFSGCFSLSSIYIPSSLQVVLSLHRPLLRIVTEASGLDNSGHIPAADTETNE